MSSVSILGPASMTCAVGALTRSGPPRNITGVKSVSFGASNPADVEETNMNLFRLDASISAYAELAGVIEEEWTAGLPGGDGSTP